MIDLVVWSGAMAIAPWVLGISRWVISGVAGRIIR
jgi:hypothetical protein